MNIYALILLLKKVKKGGLIYFSTNLSKIAYDLQTNNYHDAIILFQNNNLVKDYKFYLVNITKERHLVRALIDYEKRNQIQMNKSYPKGGFITIRVKALNNIKENDTIIIKTIQIDLEIKKSTSSTALQEIISFTQEKQESSTTTPLSTSSSTTTPLSTLSSTTTPIIPYISNYSSELFSSTTCQKSENSENYST